jgi:enamine deaminase RidA (YjgF/YER057c/UK114 family)
MPESTTVASLAPPPGYAHVVTFDSEDRFVVTAGAVPLDENGELVGRGDIEQQTRQTLGNLSAALEEVGSGLHQVAKTTVFVVAKEQSDLTRAWEVVRASELSTLPHASTLLGVSMLGYTGQLVEIEALAYKQSGRSDSE